MSRLSKDEKKVVRKLMKENKLKDVSDVHDLLKRMFGDVLEEMLEAELDDELGYSKYDYKNKNTTNSRNGKRNKKVKTTYGELDISVPRDRENEFEPQVIKKNQKDISDVEERILSMYAKGMTTRDISKHIEEIYGFNASHGLISGITNKILPLVRQWQNRPLEAIYAHILMDAIHYKVRQDGRIVNKAAYICIGLTLDGMKDVLGIWIGENESSKYWLTVLNELKNRGVKDILIASIDGLPGFSNAINAVFPKTEIQRCIVHQIRNSLRYVNYKQKKEFAKDLKTIYKAVNETAALDALDQFEEKWGKTHQIVIMSWRNHWDELSVFFKYPEEIRRMIHTTNAIESYNRQLRKVTKNRSIFPTDESLLKMLYLATIDITKKWTRRYKHWSQIISQLTIYFGERIADYTI